MHSHYLFLFFIILVVASVSQGEEDPICSPEEFNCGDLKNVSYPFSVGGLPTKCKVRGFELYCSSDGYPVINISSKRYRVRTIDYSSQTLIIVDSGFIGNNCPHPSENLELEVSIFTFADNDVNLTVYYDCPFVITDSNLHSFSCLKNDTELAYYTTQASSDPLVRSCSVSVFKLLNSAADRLKDNSSYFDDAVKEGFNLSWVVDYGKCDSCAYSGGNCNYNPIAGAKPICYCGDEQYPQKCPSRSSNKKKNIKLVIIVVVILGVVMILTAFFCLVWRWMAKQRTLQKKEGGHKKDKEVLFNSSQETKPELPIFSFSQVASATNNFSNENKLGEGGFGPVYKGMLPGGQDLAVKRLSKSSGQGSEEFKNEALIISQVQHRNLVKLLGCCIENDEKILLYEYMPKKSLDAFLFGSSKQELIDWDQRFNIIEGIARGLLYLHRDSRLKIIHRDLKPSNILLDERLNPKISDFGMARILGEEVVLARTNRVVGTYGYMSPEYAMEGTFSEKSDVFSFGVLLLEIVSSKRNSSFYRQEESTNLLSYTWKLWNESKVLELIDAALGDSYPQEEVLRCIHLGLLCVQEFAEDRPTMSTVISILGCDISTLPTPKQPAFTERSFMESGSSQSRNEIVSINDVTISELQGQ